MEQKEKEQKFSYSKVDTYRACPFKYKLVYVDNHYIKPKAVATDFGTLLHYVEEQMGEAIKNNIEIDYNYYKNLFLTVNIVDGTETVQGINILKELYAADWNKPDKQGYSYEDKSELYLAQGIYLLQTILRANPTFKIYGVEIPFMVNINGNIFKGFIDRVYYDEANNTYIIEDIKTYSKRLAPKELKESLQMYIYSVALREQIGKDINIKCFYNLPLLNDVQRCIINTEVVEGKLKDTLTKIDSKDFHPSPTPLCHWCVFSKTFPNQPEEAKNLCPYFCKWTKEKKDMSVENFWQGEDRHQIILENFKKFSS